MIFFFIIFGCLELNYVRWGNFVGDVGSFGVEFIGKKYMLLFFCDSILIEILLYKC